jgi:hypothetical protein
MVSFCTLCARPARGGSLSGPFSTLLDPPPQQQAHRRTRSPWATPASPAARHALPAVGTLLPRLLLAYSLTALPALLFFSLLVLGSPPLATLFAPHLSQLSSPFTSVSVKRDVIRTAFLPIVSFVCQHVPGVATPSLTMLPHPFGRLSSRQRPF